jgi:serine protease AprX
MTMSVLQIGRGGQPACAPKRSLWAAAAFVFGFAAQAFAAQAGANPVPGGPGAAARDYKLDDVVAERAEHGNPAHLSSVIVTLVPGGTLPAPFRRYARGGALDIINGQVLDVPNGLLRQLEASGDVFRVHDDRPASGHNYRTGVTIGARSVWESLGYTGAGVGIAVLDSGIATWHDDLTNSSSTAYPYGNQRVSKFVDFVGGRTQPYDDNGHGTHVAGSILGNGYDSTGEKSGVAPGASLVSIKVLDADGQGTISQIIAGLNWVAANYRTYNIRVANLSIGAAIRESYWTDPLTLAAKAVADKGITVVTAAGNLGQNANGQLQWGGITAPGNAPWVLTVGASSTMGTLTRADDRMADFSSAGPTWVDFAAKPDLVAPGVGTVSLATPGSTLYGWNAPYLLDGAVGLGYKPYLALSGTSMAAPVVAGTVALMLEANPRLTPNLVKALLQYTSQTYPGYSPLRQGAGFLNALGAVRLAKFYAGNRVGERMPVQKVWSQQIIWGNHQLTGGYINPRANAWTTGTVWGAATTLMAGGDNIVWGTACHGGDCDNIVWGTHDSNGDNIVWGTHDGNGDNIVWGTMGGGDNIVWGTWGGDNIVWGTACHGGDCDNIVWGTVGGDNIVWGTGSIGDNIVWGTVGGDNIVWGTWGGDNIVWGTAGGDNIVWGTNAASVEQVVFPDDSAQPLPSVLIEFGDLVPLPSGSGGGR